MAWLARLATSSLLRPTWRPTGRVRRSARGQATIEFALALPVILLIALGTVDVGRVFFDYIGLRNAAMEGAIYGAGDASATTAQIKTRVEEHFASGQFPASATVTPSRANQCTAIDGVGYVTVTISAQFAPLSLQALQLLQPGQPWSFTVNTTAKSRCMT
jgi:Flp pilus assembly protein TadG